MSWLYCLHSIEYWFRCLDTDGDGKLSLYELETFYLEVLKKMIDSGIEGLPTEDSICQVRTALMFCYQITTQ